MSLILTGDIYVKTYPAVGGMGDRVSFGKHTVSMEDFVEAMKYVLTNSDLMAGDPRTEFMTWCRAVDHGWIQHGSQEAQARRMNINEIVPGGEYVWRFVPRGGYGYTHPVDVVVLAVTAKRVKVRAPLERGGFKVVYVRPENIDEHRGNLISPYLNIPS